MRRWHSLIEILQFPLEVLFLATVLLGTGSLLLSTNFSTILTIKGEYITLFAELFRFFGGFIILNFPLLILIKSLAKRYDDSVVVFTGILGYIMFHVATMFFASTGMPIQAYYSMFGLSVDASTLQLSSSSILVPIQTGLVALFIVSAITRISYKRSRRRLPYGIFGFIDRNLSTAISTLFLSLLAGIVTALVWPTVIGMFMAIFNFIAADITNPVNLFVYGIMDRLMGIFNLSGLIRGMFWFGSLGGSWIDSFGANYLGDVGMWTAQQAVSIVNLGPGRLITPYFVLNIFAVPALLIAIYRTFTDKIERQRYLGFMVLAVIISIFSGTLLPVEIYLLIMAPLLFVFHVFSTGVLFALFQVLKVAVGYTYTGNVIVGMPGSVIDLIVYWRNLDMQRSMSLIVVIGILTFLIYLAVTTAYFQYGAVNLVNLTEKESKVNGLLESIGGLGNIRLINASPAKLTVQVYDRSVVDFSKIHHHDVSRIIETRAGYALSFGSCSYMLWSDIKKRMDEEKQSA